jgi:hypothetical protein
MLNVDAKTVIRLIGGRRMASCSSSRSRRLHQSWAWDSAQGMSEKRATAK